MRSTSKAADRWYRRCLICDDPVPATALARHLALIHPAHASECQEKGIPLCTYYVAGGR
jgi:hypothetical protein